MPHSLRDSRRMETAPPTPQEAPIRFNSCVSAAELDPYILYNTHMQSLQLFILQKHDKIRSVAAIDNEAGGGGGSNPHTPGSNVPCPFSVEPFSGDVEAGGEQSFTVRFAPQEVSAT